MSAKCLGWVFDHSPYSGAAYTIHIVLGDLANEQNDNKLWASQQWIAERSRVSRQTVNKVLDDMVTDHYLVIIEKATGRDKSNIYRFLMPESVKPDDTLEDSETVNPVDTLEGESVASGEESVKSVRESVNSLDTNSSNSKEPNNEENSNTEPEASSKPVYVRNDFTKGQFTEKFLEAWNAYPHRSGKVGKTGMKESSKLWNGRLSDGATEDDMVRATKNYALHCKRKRVEARYTMLPQTFYGPNYRFEEYLSIKDRDQRGKPAMETREDGGTFDPKALYRKHLESDE